MKRAAIILCVLTLMLGGTATVVYANEINIVIHPSIINLSSHAGVWLTVYADIPFSVVKEGTVILESNDTAVEAAFIKESDRGDLVAKFDYAEVVEAIGPLGRLQLTLRGEYTEGDAFFEGVDTIYIIDKKGEGGGN